MTAGTSGPFPPVGFLTVGVAKGRTWSGDDGKYESYGGGQRLKWNKYSLQSSSYLCNVAQFTLRYTWYNDPNFSFISNETPSLNLRPTMLDIAVTDTEKQKALTKLVSKVKAHDFNLGVELGQLGQTVNMLSGNLQKLGRAALALRRGDFSTAARQLGARPRSTNLKGSDVPGRWLELQYGWLPLLSTSYEAAKAYEAISNGPRKRVFTVAGTSTFLRELSQSPSNYTAMVKGRKGRRIQYEMYEEMSVERQLGLEDPLSIAWELTPWSFVIDWFIPIGTYLSNLNQIPKLKGRWLVTDFFKADVQKVAVGWKNPAPLGPNWKLAVLPPPIDLRWAGCHYERVFSNTPPTVPAPQFTFGGINSTRRFWNAVALASQRFLR